MALMPLCAGVRVCVCMCVRVHAYVHACVKHRAKRHWPMPWGVAWHCHWPLPLGEQILKFYSTPWANSAPAFYFFVQKRYSSCTTGIYWQTCRHLLNIMDESCILYSNFIHSVQLCAQGIYQ